MRTFHLLFFLLCLVELYAQRLRTVTNQAASTEEPRPVRTRGRSRFTATEELAQVSEKPERTTSNRRASTRTRINSNNPKVADDRRARPIEISTRGYAVEEINNDSPIDSFIRQSKPRVLTANQFEASTAGRRTNNYEASQPAPADILPVEELGFGSTARAILQARGEPLPVKTTTPVVDEEYLLTNFGNTIRTLAGSQPAASRSSSSRNDRPIQRATPLRSEVPILDQEDIPVRRTSLRADPLPSLRNSEINVEREPPARTRNGGSRGRLAEGRANGRVESERRSPTTSTTTTEATIVEEYVRFNPETDAPEVVQGLELEPATEPQSLVEIPIEDELPDEEDVRKSTVVEIFTPRSTYSPSTTKSPATSRRSGGRSRFVEESSATTTAPRSRGSRTRATRRPEESNTSSSNTRARISRRRFDDADVAESRYRGPSVFTVEQYQDVTSRSRPGRKIDSRYEAVPTRAAETPTVRSRSTGRRATTAGSTTTEKSRGRARSRSEPTSPPTSRTSGRRASLVENNVSPAAARRPSPQEELVPNARRTGFVETSRPSSRKTNIEDTKPSRKANNIEEAILNVERGTGSRSSTRRGSYVDIPSRKRVEPSRFEPVDVRSSRAQSNQPTLKTRGSSSRNVPTRQPEVIEETTIYYGEKSRKTDAPPEITTIIYTEKPVLKNNKRSRGRFPDTPPRIDESKLEVLPLFERETKATNSVRSRGSRSRSGINKRHGVDHMDASATENDVKFVEKPTTSAFTRVTVSRTESFEASTSRTRLSTRVASSSTTEVPNKKSSSTRVPVTTTAAPETTTRKITRAPPIIKESVIAEINQVTSKSTITRRKKVSKAKAAEVGSRGNKKADVKLSDVEKKKNSDEDIGEEDNYPEPFKALIQAKKLKDDSKPQPKITVAPIVQTSTPRGIVTSPSVHRGSSTARLVTTTVSPRKLQELNELINDNDNELDPRPRISSTTSKTTLRPTRSRQLPKFSEKPKQKIEKNKFSPSKPTSTPRKSYSTKSYSTKSPAVHHPRRKALRSTAVPPSTTPLSVLNRETKFSAKFIKKENNGEKQGKAFGGQLPKGLYSSKKNNENEALEEKVERKIDVSLIQSAKPVQPIKKFNASRYSSRYRSDISTRSSVIKPTTSAPFYIPTIPTPAYVPTVPTVTPPVTPVDGIVAVSDADLGVEVISFDDPINTIPSADLVNGEYLTTDRNLKLSPTVKDGTTEKPVSIIERIINSITLISTTEAPNTPLNNLPSPTTTQASGNSAILKLAAKKLTTKDKTDVQTNIIETITSEKPTTIIEKIRSSLSAIQTSEVGTSLTTSSTPLSTVTKYSAKYRGGSVDSTTALPAPLPLSTSVNPLSVFDEIDENEVLEQNAIGKLLNILNGLVTTESADSSGKLVVVTPKNLNSGFVATTFLPQEPIEAITLSSLPSSESLTSTELPSSSTLVNTQSTIPETTTTVNNDQTSTISDDTTSTTALPTTTDTPSTEATTTIIPETSTTSSTIRYTKTPTSTTSDDLSVSFPSTIPTVSSFKVSPGSVSVFSANDLINYITPDDNLFNTVTIATRVGFDFNNNNNNVLTSTTTESVTSTTTLESTTNTDSSTTTAASTTTDISSTTTTDISSTTTTDISSTTTTDMGSTTTTDISSTTDAGMTTTMLTPTISPTNNSSRSGKILSADVGEPVGNSIDVSTPSTTTSTTPDYFIFAVLNNNTILRKRPPTVPNKEVPFVIVGLLPNNTVVRKYPNGTLIPMDPIIKVRGFDTRPNPPPLVEITSNQVTDTTNGMTTPDNNAATVDSNRMARLLSTEQRNTDLPRIIISSTTVGSTSSTSTSTTGKSTVSSTSSTTSNPPSSTTTLGTTLSTSTLSPITISSTTELPKMVEIIAVPGETRISKSQARTTPSPESTSDSTTNIPSSTLETSTDQVFSSTMVQSTETIPPNLGDILNGRTVDALHNLINPELSSTTKLPNYKNLQLNQNSITSTMPTTVTTAQSTLSDALFTSPMISTESTAFFPSSSDTLLSSTLISTLMPVSTTSIPTTQSTTTTTEPTTTTLATTTTRRPETTTSRLTTTARPKTTTGFPTFAPSTILPTILTTLFPNLLRGAITTPISPLSSTRNPLIGAESINNIADGFEVLSVAGSTARPTTVLPQTSTSQRISTTTTPSTTTTQSTTTTTTTTKTTTTSKPTTATTKRKSTTNKPKTSKSGTPTPSTKEETDKLFEELKESGKLKNLNEEQRKNLEEIERIEKEQAELLKQLSILTTMFGGPNGRQPSLPISGNPVGGSSNSLANRIINMAIERDRSRPTTDSPPTSSTTKKSTKATTKRPNSIQDQLPVTQLDDTTKRVTPSLEDVFKQYNLNGLSTELPLTSTYGKTDEAVLAAILKEHGIGPTTPKDLGDKVKEAGLFDESTSTTKKPKPKPKPKSATTTTIRPPLGGRLMQGLNWLLDILDPPTTKKPAPRRAKPKTPKPAAAEEELLTNQPTRITPMITAAPVTKPNLSQEEIKGLIKQLEDARKNPNAVDQLDLTKIKSLQNLINVNEAVEVTNTGQHGATSRATPRPRKSNPTTEKDPFLSQVNQKPLASTVSTLSVSNSIDDDVELISTTTRTRVMPPVSLSPIPGIDDNTGDSVIRGNLLTAAVNVTKAISSFLGSAIQDASKQVRSMFYNGSSGVFSGLSSGSSVPSSIASASINTSSG